MKTDSITLSPEFVAEHLADCKPGETVTITATVGEIGEDGATLTPTEASVSYDEGETAGAPEETEPAMAGARAAVAAPANPAPKAKRSAAVAAVMGKK